jgi:glycerol uptake facilitator-like aquaporin
VPSLPRRLAAEGVGTAGLLAAVVGSGIMAETLAGGNVAVALLCNTLATGAVLVALILAFGAVSGAHFNPAVSLTEALLQRSSWRDTGAYLIAQCGGAILGVWLAHAMFGQPIWMISQHVRTGPSQMLSEGVATFGLLCTIFGTVQRRPDLVPFAVGAYITAAYWFTASTSFANPAVTMARSLTDTFSGIRPADVPLFVVAQLCGVLLARIFCPWLWGTEKTMPAGTLAETPSPGAVLTRSH